jgi:hypothetical protein
VEKVPFAPTGEGPLDHPGSVYGRKQARLRASFPRPRRDGRNWEGSMALLT